MSCLFLKGRGISSALSLRYQISYKHTKCKVVCKKDILLLHDFAKKTVKLRCYDVIKKTFGYKYNAPTQTAFFFLLSIPGVTWRRRRRRSSNCHRQQPGLCGKREVAAKLAAGKSPSDFLSRKKGEEEKNRVRTIDERWVEEANYRLAVNDIDSCRK